MIDTAANEIVLPYQYTPRDYQEGLWKAAFPDWYGIKSIAAKRYILVWHRRAGKDKTTINFVACKAIEEVGNYLYMAPEQTQVKKIIWQGIGSDGIKFIDHIPQQLIKKKYEKDMLIELINGSTIQLGGSDAYDSWMGTNPRGIVFSEYSLQNPQAYNYFRPILVENGGWAVFIYTPRGHNHGYDMRQVGMRESELGNPDYYYSEIDITQSRRADGSPLITQKDIDDEVAAGMPPELVQQEFYNSFDAGNIGAYYADIIGKLRQNDPSCVGHYPYDPSRPVITAWDLGIHDATSVWFVQPYEGGPRVIEYYEQRNKPLTDHVSYVLSRNYNYLEHLAPHDIEVRSYETGRTRKELAFDMGLDFTTVPRIHIEDGIEAVRALLPRCTFHESGTSEGIEALFGYERAWDDRMKRYRNSPTHNWASHGADAFRVLATGWVDEVDHLFGDGSNITVNRSVSW